MQEGVDGSDFWRWSAADVISAALGVGVKCNKKTTKLLNQLHIDTVDGALKPLGKRSSSLTRADEQERKARKGRVYRDDEEETDDEMVEAGVNNEVEDVVANEAVAADDMAYNTESDEEEAEDHEEVSGLNMLSEAVNTSSLLDEEREKSRQIIEAKDAEITLKDEALAAKDSEIAKITAAKDEEVAKITAAKDVDIALKDAAIRAKDEEIATMKAEIVFKNAFITAKDDIITAKNETIAKTSTANDATISAKNETIAAKDNVIHAKDSFITTSRLDNGKAFAAMISAKDQLIQALRQH